MRRHCVDTKPKPMAKVVDKRNAQGPEKIGAVGGNRTHMGERPEAISSAL